MLDSNSQVLVIGHPLVVNANRKLWSLFSRVNSLNLDMVVPKNWKSNLIKRLSYENDPKTDFGIRKIFPTRCFKQGNGSLFFFSPITLFLVFKRRKYDFIIINQEGWSIALVVINFVIWFTQNKNTPRFITANQNIKKFKWSWMHPYERWNTRNISGILYCADEVREVLEWKRLPAHHIYFPFSFDGELYSEYKHKIKTPSQDKIRFGYLGRISEEKGLRTLLKAIDLLAKKKLSIELVIAGAGPMDEELRMKDYVKYLGVIPHLEGHLFYQNIDVFILPSETTYFWKEQFGRVLVEAAAAGKIVIGSSSGAIPEVLGKLEMPFVFEEKNYHALVDRLNEVIELSSNGGWSSYVLNSQKRSFDLFSHESVSRDLFNEITKLTIRDT